MNEALTPRWDYYALLAFAFTAVASIVLQDFLWVSVALFLWLRWRGRQKIEWPTNLFAIATLIFLGTYFLGALTGVDPANSFHSLHKSLTFLVIFPLGAMTLSLADIRKLLLFFVAGATVCALYGVVYKHFIQHQDRIDSFSGDKMVFGGMLMAALLVNITLLKVDAKRYWLWAALPVIGLALLFTETRGAWLGFLIGSLILLWQWNKKWVLVGFLILAALFFLLPKQTQDRVKSIGDIYITRNDKGVITEASPGRLLIWIAGWHMIQDHPWGVGQDNVPVLYPKYRLENPYSDLDVPHLHDNFMQIWAQNGWVGLAAYIFWIFAFYKEAFRFKSSLFEAGSYNWMFIALFSSVLIWGLTEYTFSHQFMNVQFFMLGLGICLWKRPA